MATTKTHDEDVTPKPSKEQQAMVKEQTEYLPWLSDVPGIDTQASMMENEWGAARAVWTPIVGAKYTEQKRTYDLMVSGAPMYGVAQT